MVSICPYFTEDFINLFNFYAFFVVIYYISNFRNNLCWDLQDGKFSNFCTQEEFLANHLIHPSPIKRMILKHNVLIREDIIRKGPYFFKYIKGVFKERILYFKGVPVEERDLFLLNLS